ncbi:type-F conjugative transfer system pilin assembly protein TrbC [Novosphingobium sp. EMRT-2]|uniref:type-F conjugative transfer system pilin assembly protein TrbC n=1 Tax=Novosphingobium sp. EMRT-2 TaxID=2571749 RepID=UPI0010BE1285|nr:conjugal transfer protein TrbC [Novosphingobium sp. EMRT-2]
MLLAGFLAASGPVAAQEAVSARSSPSESATAKSQGDAAMERLKDAVARQKAQTPTGPTALPELPEAERRRAFEGLRRHAPSPAMEARARTALDAGKDAFAAQRDAMAKRLRQALGLEAPEMEAVARAAAPDALRSWVPVLFVSSSMPITTLRTYAAQLEKAGGVMAFRGMPGGLTKVGPMAKLSAEILRLDPGCEGPACAMRNVQLIVDPLVFRQHGVSAVPALAMLPGDPTQPYCERDDASPVAAHIVYGDAALSGLLEEYARLGGKQEVEGVQARLQGR